MINLLPPDYKQDIIYARKNASLRKWIIALLFALFITVAIVIGGYLYMDHSIKQEQSQRDSIQAELDSQDLNGTKKQLDDISSNLKLSIQVLSKEILFSKLIRQLGASLPENTSLQQIQIDKVSGSITLSAVAKDITSATQIQVNLSDPANKIFEKADIENISCGGNESGTTSTTTTTTQQTTLPGYPCTVQLKALFAKNNDYTYIKGGANGAAQ